MYVKMKMKELGSVWGVGGRGGGIESRKFASDLCFFSGLRKKVTYFISVCN